MTNYCWRIYLGSELSWILLALAIMPCLASDAEDLPSTAETERAVQQLFEIATKPVPPKLHLVARIEIISPTWSSEQVQKALASQELIMKDVDSRLRPQQRESLRAARLNAIADSHTGHKFLDAQEWMSDDSYRLDVTDYSALGKGAILNSNYTSRYNYSYLEIRNPRLGEPAYISSDNFYGSATIIPYANAKSVQATREKLWQALTIEPRIIAGFLVLTMDAASAKACKSNDFDRFTESFGGAQMDPHKVGDLIHDRNPAFSIKVERTVVDTSPVTALTLIARKSDPGAEATYWFDPGNGGRLYRAQVRVGSVIVGSSVRRDFDMNNFPHFYETETVEKERNYKKQIVTFKEIDLHPSFDEAVVFSRAFPSNYIVEKVVAGEHHWIQSPLKTSGQGAQIRPPGMVSDWRKRVVLVIMVALFVAPVPLMWFLRRKSTNRP